MIIHRNDQREETQINARHLHGFIHAVGGVNAKYEDGEAAQELIFTLRALNIIKSGIKS